MNKQRTLKMRVGLLAGLLVCSLLPQSALAVQSDELVQESILMSPVAKRYALDAGSTKRDSIKVVNDGKVAYDFVVYTRPYSVNDESYVPDFTSKAQNADAYKWVQFEKTSYQLEPGKSVDVPYTLRVPDDATPGGHYGVLFAETQPSSSQQGNAVLRKKRVGAILYATVNGDVTTSGRIDDTSVSFFQFNAPLTATQRVTNNGNTDFLVDTTMTVSDVFGGKKFSRERDVPVLPKTTREIRSEWPDSAWIGLYKVELHSKFLDTDKSSTHYVLMVPLWVYMTLGLLIGVRVLYEVSLRRRK